MLTLLYHGIFERNPYASFPGLSGITGAELDKQITWLKRAFSIVALNDTRPSRRPKLALTFDDGYANFMTTAYPVLRKHEVSATVFVSTSFIDSGDLWFSRVEAACLFGPPTDLVILGERFARSTQRDRVRSRATLLRTLTRRSWNEVRHIHEQLPSASDSAGSVLHSQLYAGLSSEALQILSRDGRIDVGSHTINHPVLTMCDNEQLATEVIDSRRQLEDLTGRPVALFSYPLGEYNPTVLGRTAATYEAAWAVDPTYVGTANYEHPRIGVYRGSLFYLSAKLLGLRRAPPVSYKAN